MPVPPANSPVVPDVPATGLGPRRERFFVNESFASLQGEGRLVGVPSRFIRLSGCHLRCRWCDSAQTSWQPQGVWTSLRELLAACNGGPRHVVVTGGEPLIARGVGRLLLELGEHGYHTTIETAGTIPPGDVRCDLVSISPKLAHSTPHDDPFWGPKHEAQRLNLPAIAQWMAVASWQIKPVIRWRRPEDLANDLQEIMSWLESLGVATSEYRHVFLMPECTDAAQLAEAYRALTPICLRYGFSLGQRLHIAMWGHTPGT